MKSLLVLVLILSIVFASEDKALHKFINGNKRFAADVYREVSTKYTENFLTCPLSAEIALALTEIGADLETGAEIRAALHFPNSTEELENAIETIISAIKNVRFVTFRTANKIFIKNSYPIKEEFNKTAVRIFGASSQNVDFTNTGRAANTINSWVSRQTGKKIKNLVDAESLDEDTVAVLVNAIYLQATWKRIFKTRLTKKKTFFKTSEEEIEVNFMEKQDMHKYFENEKLDAKFLKIPFKGYEICLVVVLPNKIEGLGKLEQQIEEVLIFDNFTTENVLVELPKFKIETSIDFKGILKKLGVDRAFTRPDFSRIAGDEGEIHISHILQKTFISLNEKGIEAAASTAVMFHPKSLMEVYGDLKTFKADHPFLFYIKFHDVIVFTGRVVAPST